MDQQTIHGGEEILLIFMLEGLRKTREFLWLSWLTKQYNAIQCNAIQCNAIQCNAIQYNAMQCNAMQYNTTQYNTIQYNAMQYNTMQCNATQATQCNAIQYNAMQCNAMQYNAMLKILYNAMQCNAIECNTIQCNAMQCNTIHYYTTQAVRGPITKIKQSKCSIAGPIFSKYRTEHCPEWSRTYAFAVFAFFSRVINLLLTKLARDRTWRLSALCLFCTSCR